MAEEKKEEAKKEEGKKEEPKKEEGKKEEAKDGAAPAEGGEGGAPTEGASPLSKKKKLIIIGAAALLALIISGVGVFFVIRAQKAETPEQVTAEGAEQGEHGKEGDGAAGDGAETEGQSEASKPIYIDMPEFLINLNSGGKQTSFLKMLVVLDVPDEKSKLALEANMPRIRDNFQIYLHELRAEDLKGSAGLQLLREELLLRVNKVIYPNKVNDILFKEILIQ